MSDDVAAYLLLALDLLVVAIVLSLPVLALWWLVGTPRPLPDPPPDLLDAESVPPAPGERVLRRCEACGVLFKGRPGEDASVTSLRLRRWVRRRTRARKTDTPTWARRRGWSRCPSCLSTNVRTSRAASSRR